MSQITSFSRVDTWKSCPRKYKYRYIDRIPTEPDYSATNPLILGSTLDKASQFGYEEAEKYYLSQYHAITDEGITELMKIEYWTPQIQQLFAGGEFQKKIASDRFIGYADAIVGNTLYDLKYSNNVEKYAKSPQLHIYASELEKKPDYMAYVCVPKTFIRQKQNEDIIQYRRRVMETLREMDIQRIWVCYDQDVVDQFWQDASDMWKDKEYVRCTGEACKYCEYKQLCAMDDDIPRRKIKPRSELKL